MDANLNSEKGKEVIYEQLLQFVTEIIGSDVMEELNVTKESILTKDLEMDSIEIVAFAEKVRDQYGTAVDFTSWISNIELEELLNLSFSQIVDFIYDSLNVK
ncbi:MAG: acyl carrier protein [Dysgonamonadaceae bacterium]|jgi:acyl carrier protein|nr:acyl carrier protein [Dysgonamonadaceae bacterium]